MQVSQEFINLLNLPLGRLRDIAEELDVSLPSGARKWDVVKELSKLSAGKLAPHASEWIYAGQTSVTYVKLGDGTPLDEDAVIEALTDMCEGVNPLENDIRPDVLTRKATLIDATKTDGRLFLSFGVKKPVARVLSNFEVEVVEGDDFFVAVLRLDKAIMEIRTNHQRAERFVTTWIAEFDEFLFGDGEQERQGEPHEPGEEEPA
jgi:hypothetical protein